MVMLAKQYRGIDELIWEKFAYAGRYGGQPISDLKRLTLNELVKFCGKVSDIVRSEKRSVDD